jgi:uncharacterized protein
MLLLAAHLSLAGDAGENRPLSLTIQGGAAQGTISALMEGLGEMIRREFPGSSYTYEPASPVGALSRVMMDQFPVALGGPIEIRAAVNGDPPFPHALPADSFSVIARISDGVLLYVLATEDYLREHNIASLADIAARAIPVRVSIGQPGTLTIHRQATAVLAEYGLTPDLIEQQGGKVFSLALGPSLDLLRNRKADMLITAGFSPDSRVLELHTALPVRFIPLDAAVVDRLAGTFGIETSLIAAGAYPFLKQDYVTTSTGMLLVASKSADADLIRKLAQVCYRQFDYLRSLHRLFAGYEVSMLPAAGPYPLHPAARTYYREVGLLP